MEKRLVIKKKPKEKPKKPKNVHINRFISSDYIQKQVTMFHLPEEILRKIYEYDSYKDIGSLLYPILK